MRLTVHDSAAGFLDRTGPFLAPAEAENNLMLGLAGAVRGAAPAANAPYFATVEDCGRILAAALRTPGNRLILSTADPSKARAVVSLIAADRHAHDPALPGVQGPTDLSRAFAEDWRRLTGRSFRQRMVMRIYRLDAVTPPTAVSGTLRRATTADRELVIRWIAAFGADIGERPDPQHYERFASQRLVPPDRANETPAPPNAGLYFWMAAPGGGAIRRVSMAGYTGWTPTGVQVNAVYTPPDLRRRGYAGACVAALSQLLLDSGRAFCFLFTDLANPTSNHVYQAIGYRPVCDVDDYEFTGVQ